MSKRMSEVELLAHCSDSIAELKKMLEEFSKSGAEKIRKRAMLIAYWLKTYIRYLRTEDTFAPESVFRLKRGAVVRVEFGYRVGRELGGRHYAVVLDTKNSVHRNTVTVIPLGSLKADSEDDEYNVVLENGVYGQVEKKLKALIADAQKSLDEALEMTEEIDAAPPDKKPILRAVQRQKINSTQNLVNQAKAWEEELLNLKAGSVAKVDQVTTVSKMRISQPLQKTHPLYGLRLSPQDLDKIDSRLLGLYFPTKKT